MRMLSKIDFLYQLTKWNQHLLWASLCLKQVLSSVHLSRVSQELCRRFLEASWDTVLLDLICRVRVNPISLSYPFPLPLPLSFARSRESKGYPNSGFDRGVGLRGSGRYPLKPSIFASLLETKGYPEHTAQPASMSARSSRESHFRLK